MVDNWLGKFGALLSNSLFWVVWGGFIFLCLCFSLWVPTAFQSAFILSSKTVASLFLLVLSGNLLFMLYQRYRILEGTGFWTNRLIDARWAAGAARILVFAALAVLIIL